MRNLFVKTALVLCTTIIFLPATIFATEPQNTEVTSAEEGFTLISLVLNMIYSSLTPP